MAEHLDPHWAWQRYRPTPDNPWDLKKAGHLYRRATFGATWAELQTAVQEGPEHTVERLFHTGPGQKTLDDETAMLARTITEANNGQEARAWWLYRMLYSTQPLREKMTLFWHNHFATSNVKVKNAGFMLGQYRLMHEHALGSFRTMLEGMSKDPAMMIWLDTSQSKKGKANENYARELMELFSLGIGHYTEKDVREGARAFTGWRIKDRKALFVPGDHDDGRKTFLGQTGNWGSADIVRICLEQPCAATFIVGKLFQFLVSETVPATPCCSLRWLTSSGPALMTWAGSSGPSCGPTCFTPPPFTVRASSRRWTSRLVSSGPWKAASARPPWQPRWKSWGKTCSIRPRSKAGTAVRRG